MVFGHKLRHTVKRLGQKPGAADSAASPAGDAGTFPRSTGPRTSMPTLDKPRDRARASTESDNTSPWEDRDLTSDEDVEVDTVTHERMERLRDLAERVGNTSA